MTAMRSKRWIGLMAVVVVVALALLFWSRDDGAGIHRDRFGVPEFTQMVKDGLVLTGYIDHLTFTGQYRTGSIVALYEVRVQNEAALNDLLGIMLNHGVPVTAGKGSGRSGSQPAEGSSPGVQADPPRAVVTPGSTTTMRAIAAQ